MVWCGIVWCGMVWPMSSLMVAALWQTRTWNSSSQLGYSESFTTCKDHGATADCCEPAKGGSETMSHLLKMVSYGNSMLFLKWYLNHVLRVLDGDVDISCMSCNTYMYTRLCPACSRWRYRFIMYICNSSVRDSTYIYMQYRSCVIYCFYYVIQSIILARNTYQKY
jgi:hypothetical protein